MNIHHLPCHIFFGQDIHWYKLIKEHDVRMGNRRDEIRKRIEKRRKSRQPPTYWSAMDEERFGMDSYPSFEVSGDDDHPLFNKEVLMFKILCSALLTLAVAIIFKNTSPSLENTRALIQEAMSQEFQFASIANWYENTFDQPLALFPTKSGNKSNFTATPDYAVPASGKVKESFDETRQGVMIETEAGADIEAINDGLVVFAGKKEGLGNTVIIQHVDRTESWYGHLQTIDVTLYQPVSSGEKIGTAQMTNEQAGQFYFAIKKDNHFIDPIQVISFE
jgi:stage IV sporulation protein FA